MIKAIPTIYKSIEFRSKLEAQWAATLDALEVPWLYEVEGYQLSDGTRYLPDFYLPDSDQFFEVKGIMTNKDMHKIEQLNKDSDKDVVIGYSDGHVQMRYKPKHLKEGARFLYENDIRDLSWIGLEDLNFSDEHATTTRLATILAICPQCRRKFFTQFFDAQHSCCKNCERTFDADKDEYFTNASYDADYAFETVFRRHFIKIKTKKIKEKKCS